MDLFEKTCLGGITLCAGILLIECALLVREVRVDADKITGEVSGWNRGVWNVLGDTSAAMKVVAQIGAKERNDFDAQQSYYKTLTTKTGDLLDSATTTLNTFNGTILPRVAAALDGSVALETSASRNLTDTAIKIDDTIDALRPAIDNAISATAAASAAMSDPAIHETLAHVDGTASNLNAASSDFAAYVHRMTAPARGVWNALIKLLGLAAQARQASGI